MEVISIERSTYEVIGLPFRSSKNHKDEGDG